jgi:hypothetical protein
VEVGEVTAIVTAAAGLAVGGPIGAIVGGVAPLIASRLRSREAPTPPVRLVLLLLLVQLRSGLSVLAALIAVSEALPADLSLRRVARVARVSGLIAAIPHGDDRLRPMLSQLARAQRSGASLSGVVRRMLETELATERARRIARARTLPVRLMVPVTLLMLPGLVLLLYAPSLLGMFHDLTGVFS